MAQMTQQQISAELKRKASIGVAPTSSANQAQYNQLKPPVPNPVAPTTPPAANSSGYQGSAIGAGISALGKQVPQSTSSAPAPKPYTPEPNTNYVEKGGSALNQILYDKQQYDAGNKGWAANDATSYYAQLKPEIAAQVKGMNTQQLKDYINGLGGYSDNTGTPTSAPPGFPAQGQGQGTNTSQPTGYQSSYTGPDTAGMEDKLKSLYNNRLASELQKLRDARDTALQGYNSQETTAKQGAYDNRNQADTMNLQNEQRMKETMANGGLTTDGQNLSLQAAQNAQRLSAIGDINRQETNSLQDISQKRSLLQNNAAANELGLTQQVNSDQAAALYDLAKYGDTRSFEVDQSNYGRYRDDVSQQFARDQFDYGKTQDKIQNDANYGGTYGGNQTFAARQAKIQNDAQYGGSYNGNLTTAQQQQIADNKYRQGIATGTLGNGQKTLENKQFEYGKTRDNVSDSQWNKQFDYSKGRDTVGDKQWQDEFNNRVKQQGIDNALSWAASNRAASNAATDNSLAREKFNYQKEQDAKQGSGKPDLYKDINTFNEAYLSKDFSGKQSVSNPDALRRAILAKKYSDDETDQLLTYYGLSTN